MASYPTGIYAPASKSAGQTIQASFFNDPEAEITALETALLNGLAHSISVTGTITASSGLTVSTGATVLGGALQVAGGSTFAAPVVMSSGLTVTGGLTVDGAPVLNQTKLWCEVTHGSSQTVTVNTWTGLSWNTETLDVGGLHSTSANSSRINLTSTGLWAFGVTVEWESNSTGFRRIQLLLNDTSVLATDSETVDAQPAVPRPMTLETMGRVASTTEYVGVRVFSNDATAISANSSNGYRFWAYRVSS